MSKVVSSDEIQKLVDYYKLEKVYQNTANELTGTFDALEKRLKSINNGNKQLKINEILDFYPISEFEYQQKVLVDVNLQCQIIYKLNLQNTQWYVVKDRDYYDDVTVDYYVCNHLLEDDLFLTLYIDALKANFIDEQSKIAKQIQENNRRVEVEKLKELQQKYGDVGKYYDLNGNYISVNTPVFTMPNFKGNIDDLQKVSY